MPYSQEFDRAIASCNIAKIEELIHSIDWNDSSDGFVPSSHYLMVATETANCNVVRLLIESGANINRQDEDGWTVLIFAALEGYLDLVKLFIKSGADANIESPEGEYALYIAASQGHQEIFNYLLPLTSPELRKEAENRLYEKLAERQRYEEGKPSVRLLIKAASEGNFYKVRQAIKMKVDLDACDERGCTPLQAAVGTGTLEVINALLKAGADPNSSLAIAVATDRIDALQLLIEAGADINRIVRGSTALHVAAFSSISTKETIQYLIENGADINIRDTRGNTPLMYAIEQSSIIIVKKLLAAGASKYLKNNEGQTALDIAIELKNKAIASLLR